MKYYFSGLGCLVPIVVPSVLLVVMFLALDDVPRDDFAIWGRIGLISGGLLFPLGAFVNSSGRVAARGGPHHFSFIPLQWWGGLLLVLGGALFGWGMFSAEEPSTPPCSEVHALLSDCPFGSSATTLDAACEDGFGNEERGAACLRCVRSASNTCWASCEAVCRGE